MDFDHLVGRKEAVADALFQRVRINRVTKIGDVGDVFRLLRCCGQADLRSRGEIFEYFTPSRILGGTAAMTLVNDDKIEKAARELAEQLLPILRSCDRLIMA